MTVTFSSISQCIHSKLDKAVPLGHVHQLVAAALGYNSFAAYNASSEEPAFLDDAAHIVLDPERFKRRQKTLNQVGSPSTKAPLSVIRDAFLASLPETRVHMSQQNLEDDIRDAVIVDINDSDVFISEQAMTNAYGGDYELDFTSDVPLEENQPDWVLSAAGTCTLEQDLDRIYYGHQIIVSARVVFSKIGRRILSAYKTEEIGATIQHDWGDEDSEPGHPALPATQGVAP